MVFMDGFLLSNNYKCLNTIVIVGFQLLVVCVGLIVG